MSRLDKLRRSVPIVPQTKRQPVSPNQREVGPARNVLAGRTAASDPHGAVFRHHWFLWVGPVVMLVAALFPWPYGYYNFLRICVCGAAAFLAYQQWTHDDAASKWVVMLVAIAVLYNPLVPVHLTREIWTVLNLGTAVAFIGHFRLVRVSLVYAVGRTRQLGQQRSDRLPVRRNR